jgi:lysophospholipase L1-like esterase
MIRFLALGDSYTVGEGVDPTESWPVLLVALLRREGRAVAEPTIVACTGWTTDELAARLAAATWDEDYSLTSLLIGVNDQYRGRSPEEYRLQFRALLQRSVRLTSADPSRVIVLSIPDWGATPFAGSHDRAIIAAEIDRFNAISLEESQRVGAHHVDVTTVSRKAGGDKSLLASDGLHPSAELYKRWVEAIAPIARNILS